MITIGAILEVAIAFLGVAVVIAGPVAGSAYLLSIFRGITLEN
jgi:hypothetical protein